MDARSGGSGERAQSVWRAELDLESGQFAGSRASRQRDVFTFEKHNETKTAEIMNKQTQAISNDMNQLADDARALMNATADVAGEKVGEARKRLAAALERGRELCNQAKEKAVEGAKVADEAVHQHPYQAMGIAMGVGAVFGFLISRRCSRHCD